MFTEVRLHDPLAFHGRVELRRFTSEVLAANPLGDPATRELPVYLPPGAGDGGERLPLLFVLAGFTGRGQAYLETHPWRRGLVARYDAALARGEAERAILALPDAFTALGGSQYVNSGAVGRYEDHIADELVPWVLAHDAGRAGDCGVLGKSSGGIGALHLAMVRPDRFRACASISGDCGFDAMWPGEFLATLRHLALRGETPAEFLARFRAEPDLSGDGHAAIITFACAACYSPNAESELGFDLPFDLVTGELVPDVWERWLAFDPIHAARRHADALRGLRRLHVECGLADEYHLQWGARRLSRELARLEVAHTHEEHDGGHGNLDERYLHVIDELARALAGGSQG